VNEPQEPIGWEREGKRPWYWRSTLSFLTKLPDRKETLASVFRRHEHAELGGKRMDLDHLHYLVEIGEVPEGSTVGGAIHALKQFHKAGATHDRDWQRQDRDP
jgi:hypothetical protein